MPAVSFPSFLFPNDEELRFCQRCSYFRPRVRLPPPKPLKPPTVLQQIEARREALLRCNQSTPYYRQKSSSEKERVSFLQNLSPPCDLQLATPDDVVSFLMRKTSQGKQRCIWAHAQRLGQRTHLGAPVPLG